VTEVSAVAYLKAYSSIVLTLEGIVTEVRPEANEKAELPIVVTPSGMTALPVQPECSVTTLFEIVNEPEPVTAPSVTQSIEVTDPAKAGAMVELEKTKANELTRINDRRTGNHFRFYR
jgi:hypothetical protein